MCAKLFSTILIVLLSYEVVLKEPETIVEHIQVALNLGNTSVNYTREECFWRANNDVRACPDPDVNYILYTGQNETHGVKVDMSQEDALRTSDWDALKHNIVFIHGYAGGDGVFPGTIVRDAYVRNGSYNVFVVDWGPLAKAPCYPAAVHNLKTVGRCTAQLFNYIRNTGVSSSKITCVGHSLGAHACGQVSEYLLFRMHRIIALDPAKPLIRSSIRLRPGTADAVHVMHTNAGAYGESGKLGKVDFCVNGGKIQPLCENTTKADLCSHVLSLCYLAESLNGAKAIKAAPCSRRCPTGSRPNHRLGIPVIFGEHTPQEARGAYCVSSKKAPYCPRAKGDVGHPWCCLDAEAQAQPIDFEKFKPKEKKSKKGKL